MAATGCTGDDAESSAPASEADADADSPTTTSDDGSGEGPAVPSPGCEGGTTGEVVKKRREVPGTVGDGGAPRWYLLTAPAGAEPQPLVLSFHGLAEGAEIHTLTSEMGELGLTEGFTTAFPSGTGEPVSWKVFDGGTESPDLAYVTALLDAIGDERCIDTSRVYATGFSNGAMMTSLLACTMADRIAAFAPVAGLTDYDDCEPSRPAPMLTFHGTADAILYFNGGVGDLSVIDGNEPDGSAPLPDVDLDGEGYPATAQIWAERNGCDPDATDEPLGDELIERTWDCPDGAEVTFVIVEGGGHSWPGSAFSAQIEPVVGPTTTEIDASDAAWEMFQRHQLPA